jgi:hypothetical protein
MAVIQAPTQKNRPECTQIKAWYVVKGETVYKLLRSV